MCKDVFFSVGVALLLAAVLFSFSYSLDQTIADLEANKDQVELSHLDWNEIQSVSYSQDLTRLSRALAVVCDYTVGITPMSRYNTALSIIKQMEYVIEKKKQEERNLIWNKHHAEEKDD